MIGEGRRRYGLRLNNKGGCCASHIMPAQERQGEKAKLKKEVRKREQKYPSQMYKSNKS